MYFLDFKFLGTLFGIFGTVTLAIINTVDCVTELDTKSACVVGALIFLILALLSLMKMVIEAIQEKQQHLKQTLELLNKI